MTVLRPIRLPIRLPIRWSLSDCLSGDIRRLSATRCLCRSQHVIRRYPIAIFHPISDIRSDWGPYKGPTNRISGFDVGRNSFHASPLRRVLGGALHSRDGPVWGGVYGSHPLHLIPIRKDPNS